MKCMYYLVPDAVASHQVSDDLREVGVEEWLVHVISKDRGGIRREKLQSSNWFETKDLLRCGFIGANLGFIAGVIGAGLIMLFQPFGVDVPGVAYFFAVMVATLFGAWVGGLTGIDSENQKLRRFHDDLESGKSLVLIYARKGMGEKIKQMMRAKHPESRHVATDRHFINPFAQVERRRRGRGTSQIVQQ